MKEIDATNKKLGRIAQEAAMALMGKDDPSYEPNKVNTEGVHIINASKVDIDVKKMEGKKYKWYTGYPSGLKDRTLAELIEKKGISEVFVKAITGMLPNNKLRKPRLKQLKISE
jgi:large subunit ribosomal protein L13